MQPNQPKTVFWQWNTKNPNQPNQPKTAGPNRTRPWLLRSASSTTLEVVDCRTSLRQRGRLGAL